MSLSHTSIHPAIHLPIFTLFVLLWVMVINHPQTSLYPPKNSLNDILWQVAEE